MRENIKVVVRFRPLNEREKKNGNFCVNIDKNNINITQKHKFTFDHVFNQNISQAEIFETFNQHFLRGIHIILGNHS